MGSPLGRTLHSGCPKSWKILGIRMFASVVLAASGLLLASNVNASPQLFGPSPSIPSRTSAVSAPRRQNEAAIVGSVISALQPTIAEAVAAALAATSTRPSSSSSGSGASSGFIPARDSNATPAKYNYIYKVADDGTQTYISQEEQRDGLEVQGTYSYVDPTGAIVTVNYNAGVNGYEETRSREEGAVKIAPVQPPATSSTSSTTGLNTDAIIAQVLAALRPTIQTTVTQFVSRG